MKQNRETSNAPEAISPRGIARDILASVLLLMGTWLIEALKSLLEPTTSWIVFAILNISEYTLLIYFLGALLRAVAWTYRELDSTLKVIRHSASWKLFK